MENHSIEGVRHVYSRACTIHLPKKPMVHMLWAAFEEQQGKSNVSFCWEGLFLRGCWMSHILKHLHRCFRQHR